MKSREIERILKDNGFSYVRTARHGEFWSDGISMLLIPRRGGPRGSQCWRIEACFRRDLRRALEKRIQVQQTVP